MRSTSLIFSPTSIHGCESNEAPSSCSEARGCAFTRLTEAALSEKARAGGEGAGGSSGAESRGGAGALYEGGVRGQRWIVESKFMRDNTDSHTTKLSLTALVFLDI